VAETLLLRYGELALKSPPVRREFEGRLKGNILKAFLRAGMECTVTGDHGHLYVQTASSHDALPLVRRVFGLVSVSPVDLLETDLEAISAHVVSLAKDLGNGSRFAVRSRRTGTHPFTSHDVDVKVGAAILGAYPEKRLKVDLTNPEVEFYVEVRGPKTYVCREKYSAPGGFPIGVAGRIGAVIDGKRGALGAWLMMKRGCRVYPVVSGEGRSFLAILKAFDPELAEAEEVGAEKAWETMKALVSDRHLGGVALQLTVEDHVKARSFWGETVIFSPTVGMTDAEVEARWQEITGLAQ
jgi:thiamine biosynthesis protein ThiI